MAAGALSQDGDGTFRETLAGALQLAGVYQGQVDSPIPTP